MKQIQIIIVALGLAGCSMLPASQPPLKQIPVPPPKAVTQGKPLPQPIPCCKTWVDADRLAGYAKAGNKAQYGKMLPSERCTVLPAGLPAKIVQWEHPYSLISFQGKDGKPLTGWVPSQMLVEMKK